MKEFRIKNVQYNFKLDSGNIYNLKITNPKFLVDLILKLKLEDEETFMLYDKELLNPFKYLIFVDDLFSYDVNTKKNLSNLYSKLEKAELNSDKFERYTLICEEINDFLNEITKDYSIDLEFDDTFELKTLFNAIKLKYKQESSSFLEMFIGYLKILRETNPEIGLIITLNMFDYLKYEEIDVLIKEIEFLHMNIINIGNSKGEITTVEIDDDLCEIVRSSV